jgi:curved DNA-binding protein CbpA
MKDLYETLGVKRNAKPSEIKHAFRVVINLHHPDHNDGVDDGKMDDINAAYHVLMDSAKRKVYDETGYYEETHVPSIEEESLALISKYIEKMIDKYQSWLMYVDFIREIIKEIKKLQHACNKNKAENEVAISTIKNCAEKIIFKDGDENIVSEILISMSHINEHTVSSSERFLKISDRAIEILGSYEFKPDSMTKEQEKEFEEFKHPKIGIESLMADIMSHHNNSED